MGLEYFSIGFRAASSFSELQRFSKGLDFNIHLIKDALALVSSCREACSSTDIFSLGEEGEIYSKLIYGGVQNEEEILSRLESMDVAFQVCMDISEGKAPFIRNVERGVDFFNMIYEKCWYRARDNER